MEEKNSEKDIKSSFLTFLGEGISLSGVEERSGYLSSISKSSSFIMNKVLSDDLVKGLKLFLMIILKFLIIISVLLFLDTITFLVIS